MSADNSPHANIRKQSNLRLLQRVCNATSSAPLQIQDICATATHVVGYEYQMASSQWTKLNMEGSIFIVQGTKSGQSAIFYQLILLNRTSSQNLITDITAELQVQDESPYMIVRHGTKIHGFYFHNADERSSFTTQFQKIMERVQTTTPQTAIPQSVSTPVSSAVPEATNDAMSVSMAAMSLKSVLGIGGAGTAPAQMSPARVERPDAVAHSKIPAESGTSTVHSPNATTENNNTNTVGVVMDKHALQLTLLSLIQNDQFIDILHAQYLKVVKSRAAKQQQQQQQRSSSTG